MYKNTFRSVRDTKPVRASKCPKSHLCHAHVYWCYAYHYTTLFFFASFILLSLSSERSEARSIDVELSKGLLPRVGEEAARRSPHAPLAPRTRAPGRSHAEAYDVVLLVVINIQKLTLLALPSSLRCPPKVLVVAAHLTHLAEVAFAVDQCKRVGVLYHLAPVQH